MGFNLGQVEEDFTVDDQSWFGSAHGTDTAESITLDASAFPIGTFPDGIVPSGVVLGEITATGLYAPYAPAAIDGTEVARGHLLTVADVTKGDTVAALFWHGQVIRGKLPAASGRDAAAEADLGLIHYVG